MTAYAAALARATARSATTEIGAARTKPGSTNALIASYYKLVFPTLGEGTQAMRRGILERFREDFGQDLVANFERQRIAAIVAARAKTPHAANNLRKVLRHLFEHAIEINLRADNPVIGTKRFKTHLDCRRGRAVSHALAARQRYALGDGAGQRAGDAARRNRLGPQHERPATPDARYGWLDLRRLKGSDDTIVPISAELRAAIDACAPFPHLTYLTTKNGNARSAKSLTGDFRTWCDAAGLPKRCRLHGLKKSGLTELANSSATVKEMQAISGHRSLAVLQKYIDKTDQPRLAAQAMAKRAMGRAVR
jgi:integrase